MEYLEEFPKESLYQAKWFRLIPESFLKATLVKFLKNFFFDFSQIIGPKKSMVGSQMESL